MSYFTQPVFSREFYIGIDGARLMGIMGDSLNFFSWSAPEMSLGIQAMDTEKQLLISLMNRLYAGVIEGKNRTELTKLFKEYREFAIKHFQNEEAYMKSIGFPEAARHEQLHGVFTEKLNDHFKQFEEGSGSVNTAFFEFWKAWLTAHIKKEDIKYSKFNQGLKWSA